MQEWLFLISKYYRGIHFVDDNSLASQLLRSSDDLSASEISSDDKLATNACGNLISRSLKEFQLSSN